jgi:predicted glycosyl hydrolase (DUF1957 family)
MLWINFLHIYQPATTDAYTIKEATEKSYLRIIRALEEHPQIKFTININGCLIERWEELGYGGLIKRIKKLIDKGQIEIVGTAFFHPLLPLIPEEEAKKQIKEQEKILKKYFGDNIKLKGFFLPEMAYGENTGKLIKKLGYEWIILDEISAGKKLNTIKTDQAYQDKKSGLKIIFRSRANSSIYFPDKFFKKNSKDDKIFVTATDGELYGLKHEDPTAEFEKTLKHNNLHALTISEFLKNKETQKINLIPSNWETTEKETKNKNYYALWSDKNNIIQKKLWAFADFTYKTINFYKKDENYFWAGQHLSRGLSSCAFWWASGRDFHHVFGPMAWGPDEIEKGMNELLRAVRTLDSVKTKKVKLKAEKMYIYLRKIIWEKHWQYYWKK